MKGVQYISNFLTKNIYRILFILIHSLKFNRLDGAEAVWQLVLYLLIFIINAQRHFASTWQGIKCKAKPFKAFKVGH